MRQLKKNRGKREFKNTKRGHNKFWNIEWHWRPSSGEGTVKTTWGRIGATPTSNSKQYRSAGALENFVNAKVREKLQKGYKEEANSLTKNRKTLSEKDLVAYYKELCGSKPA